MAAIARRPRLPLYAALAAALIAGRLQPAEAGTDRRRTSRSTRTLWCRRQACGGRAGLRGTGDAEPADARQLPAAERRTMGGGRQYRAPPSKPSPPCRRRRAPSLPTPRALVAAEIAYAENDGARAIRELDQIPVPTSAGSGAELLVDSRPQRLSHRRTRSRARAPWSNASASSPIPPRCARIATELYEQDSQRRGTRPLAEGPREDRSHRRSAGWSWDRSRSSSLAIPMRATAASTTGSGSIPSILPTTACWRRPRRRSRSRPNSPTRSPCCCRCPAAPRRSASRCATASSPPISSKMPASGRV